MGTNRTHRFGPGSLESIALIESPARHERFQTERTGHRQVRAEGWFTIYCGAGNEHTEWISTPAFCLGCGEVDMLNDDPARPDFLHDAAADLVEWAIQDWTDPCEDGWDADEMLQQARP